MNDKTIQELRNWMDRYQNSGEDTNAMLEEYFSILSRAKEAKEEPLAVLADKKGYFIRIQNYSEWDICISAKTCISNKTFSDKSLEIAEAKARAYLAGLPDKEAA